MDIIRYFHITHRGTSHARENINCQDSSRTCGITNTTTGEEIAIAAVADGLSSCRFSEFGSRIAVDTVVEMLAKELETLVDFSESSIISLLKRAFKEAVAGIQTEADTKQLPYLLFDTTLTVAVLLQDGTCFFGHVGDGGIVALNIDGTYKMVTERITGQEAHSVFPLSSMEKWTFGRADGTVAALALATDGVLNEVVGSKRYNNRVYYPFFKTAFEYSMVNEKAFQALFDSYNEYLGDDDFLKSNGQNGDVTDDITFALVQQTELLQHVTPVPFDEQKWLDDSRRIKKQIEEELGYHNTISGTDKNKDPEQEDGLSRNETENGFNAQNGNCEEPIAKRQSENADIQDEPVSAAGEQKSKEENGEKQKTSSDVQELEGEIAENAEDSTSVFFSGHDSDGRDESQPDGTDGRHNPLIRNDSEYERKNVVTNKKIIAGAVLLIVVCAVALTFGIMGKRTGYRIGYDDGIENAYAEAQTKLDAAYDRGYADGLKSGEEGAYADIQEKLNAEYNRGYAEGIEIGKERIYVKEKAKPHAERNQGYSDAPKTEEIWGELMAILNKATLEVGKK